MFRCSSSKLCNSYVHKKDIFGNRKLMESSKLVSRDVVSKGKPKITLITENNLEVKEEQSSFLKFISYFKCEIMELHKLKYLTVRSFRKTTLKELSINKQKYIEERHKILGPDLATATFVVFRGGKVKFCNSDKWIEMNEEEDECNDLPTVYREGFDLEAIDASHTELRYEGLVNFVHLEHVKWLSFRNCPYVDDWFVDRISGEFSETLEYLDLSDCKNITHSCLSCIYRFAKLRTLVLNNVVNDKSFQFMCLLLEDSVPGLTINGWCK